MSPRGAVEFTAIGLGLEMSVPRAGSSAVCGGDLPCKGGELSISRFLLKFPPEPEERKSLSCYRKQSSSSRFPSLYKGNQPLPGTSSSKSLSKVSLICQ